MAGVGAACPVSVGVGDQLVDRPGADVEAGGLGALHIAKNVLDQCKVRLPRVMHKQTNLLYCICEIRIRQGQVLESTGEAAVLRGVGDRWTIGADVE